MQRLGISLLNGLSAHLTLLLQSYQYLLLPLLIEHALCQPHATALTTSVRWLARLALTLLRHPMIHL